MHFTKKTLLYLSLFAALVIFCQAKPAAAHVEDSNMPDSVAEMEYRILLEFKPDNLDVRLRLGMVLFRAEKYAEAADQFNYVLARTPQNSDALVSLAQVKMKLQDYQKAAAMLQKATQISPDNMHAYYLLGQTLEMQGDFPGAENVYSEGLAKTIPPENKHSLEERGLVEQALKNLQAQDTTTQQDKKE